MPAKTPRKDDSAGAWGLGDIREILDLLEERGISEFEMEKNGFRVRIKREPAQERLPRHAASLGRPESVPIVVGPAAINSKAVESAAAAQSGAKETPQASEDVYVIKSPIVGTFYAAPAPDVPPFVKVGDSVQPGQVLCIIEAMKLMNEIEAEVAGEITRVYVENGQPVEYGQALFGVLPSSSE
jgi:acetyl-CoA carboxylase biotin carboxyl carrier protein